MSGNVEGFVRPFQLPDFAPPQNAPSAQYTPIHNPILSVGAQGSCKTIGGSFNLTQTYFMINKPTEEKKQ